MLWHQLHLDQPRSSWLVNTALELVTPEQRAVLEAHYGKKDEASVTRIKQLYRDLDLPTRFAKYEEESYARLTQKINAIADPRLPPAVFTLFINKIYKRTK